MKQPTELPEDVREALGELLLEVFIENKNKKEYPVGQLEKRVGLLFSQELSKAQAKGERIGREKEREQLFSDIQKLKQFTIHKNYRCPKCHNYYSEDETYCSEDGKKLEMVEIRYPETLQVPYNRAIDDVLLVFTPPQEVQEISLTYQPITPNQEKEQ